jgi:Flp pilus assembly protein TadG
VITRRERDDSGRAGPRRRRRHGRGQGLVEFALGITVFMTLFVGLVDLARAAFLFNGVSDAAREIARVTSVHPGATLGTSSESSSAAAHARGLVPDLTVTSYECIDIAGATVTGTCHPGSWVRVSVRASFNAVLPILSAFGPFTMTTSSSAKIQ